MPRPLEIRLHCVRSLLVFFLRQQDQGRIGKLKLQLQGSPGCYLIALDVYSLSL
jgi:hypothetical protein